MLKNKKKAVVIAEDTLFYCGLRHILEEHDYSPMRISISREDISERHLLSRLIIVVVRDVDERVIDICRKAALLQVHVPVIAIYTKDANFSAAEMRHLGVRAALSIYDSAATMEKALLAMEKDKTFISDRLMLGCGEDYLLRFTRRQYEVYKLMLRGMDNREIARALQISEKTVRNHASHINRVLGTTNRYQAVVRYYKTEI